MTESASSSKVELLQLFFNPDDFSFGVAANIWIVLALLFAGIGITIWKIKIGKWGSGNFEIDEAEIGFGDQKFKLKPNHTDRQVAYAIWVELSTRKIGLEIDPDHDVIVEIYQSWYDYFTVTRELIKGISVSQIENTSTRAIINLSIDILNRSLRPHLTRWQARFRRWYERELKRYDLAADDDAIDPQEIQKRFPEYEALKEDMERVNRQLIAYRSKMYSLIHSRKS